METTLHRGLPYMYCEVTEIVQVGFRTSDGTSDCMFVFLSLLLGMQIVSLWRHIVFRSSAISLISFCRISCNYLVNGTFFGKRKTVVKIRRVFRFSLHLLSEAFANPRSILWSIRNLRLSACKVSLFYSDLIQRISVKIPNIKFREIPSNLSRYE